MLIYRNLEEDMLLKILIHCLEVSSKMATIAHAAKKTSQDYRNLKIFIIFALLQQIQR